jgi:excisionase family DNA binding protein
VSAHAPPLAYTDAEISSLLKVSRRTVFRLRKSGALRAVRIGRAVRTPAEEITRLLAMKQEHMENVNADKGPLMHPQQ